MDQTPAPGPGSPTVGGPRIGDLAGLVAGFGLAAFAVRSLAPGLTVSTAPTALALALLYLWLGLAMSGPAVLWLDRRGPAAPGAFPSTDATSRYTREEMAWIMVGCYLDAVALLVLPALRLIGSRSGALLIVSSAWILLLSLMVVSIVIFWRWCLPRPGRPVRERASSPGRWTRRAARLLLWTWPLAWALMVALAS